MRKISLATGVLGFSLLISAALVSVQGPSFVADLSGAEEAPPIDTGGSGLASFLLNPGSTALTFEVMAANIRDVTASHIHCGPAGANGPIGVTLSEGAPGMVAGIFARGVITAPDPGNACGWANFAAIVGGMRSGNTYVNVHTAVNPSGEIRGQIRSLDCCRPQA